MACDTFLHSLTAQTNYIVDHYRPLYPSWYEGHELSQFRYNCHPEYPGQCSALHRPCHDELAGKSASELYNELMEMKARSYIESIMDRQARGYTDAQLELILDYFASLPGNGDD